MNRSTENIGISRGLDSLPSPGNKKGQKLFLLLAFFLIGTNVSELVSDTGHNVVCLKIHITIDGPEVPIT
jgi:hypothetical protein